MYGKDCDGFMTYDDGVTLAGGVLVGPYKYYDDNNSILEAPRAQDVFEKRTAWMRNTKFSSIFRSQSTYTLTRTRTR